MAFDSKEYYRKNKERINEYNRQYFKNYYQKNKDKLQLKQYEYRKYIKPNVELKGCIIQRNVQVTL